MIENIEAAENDDLHIVVGKYLWLQGAGPIRKIIVRWRGPWRPVAWAAGVVGGWTKANPILRFGFNLPSEVSLDGGQSWFRARRLGELMSWY